MCSKCEFGALTAAERPLAHRNQFVWLSVVEQQSARVPAEGLLVLGGLLRSRARRRSDLRIAWVLLHADVG
jgi:hypothetical protein